MSRHFIETIFIVANGERTLKRRARLQSRNPTLYYSSLSATTLERFRFACMGEIAED